jgi:hypothetical protein
VCENFSFHHFIFTNVLRKCVWDKRKCAQQLTKIIFCKIFVKKEELEDFRENVWKNINVSTGRNKFRWVSSKYTYFFVKFHVFTKQTFSFQPYPIRLASSLIKLPLTSPAALNWPTGQICTRKSTLYAVMLFFMRRTHSYKKDYEHLHNWQGLWSAIQKQYIKEGTRVPS